MNQDSVMKKFYLILVAMSVMAFANAQGNQTTVTQTNADGSVHTITTTTYEKQTVSSTHFSNNWEIGLSVGPSFYIGEYDYKANILDWWSIPAVDLTITKWASPLLGLSMGFSYHPYKGLRFANDDNCTYYSSSDKQYKNTEWYSMKGGYLSMNIYGSFSISNLIYGGYDENRTFNLVGFIGAGMLMAVQTDVTQFGAAMQIGLRNQWMLNKRWSIDATLSGSLIAEDFDGKGWSNTSQRAGVSADNFPLDGAFTAMIGASYRFGFDKNDPWAYTWAPVTTVIERSTDEYAQNIREEAKREVAADNEKLEKVAAAACGAGVDVERLTGDHELAARACANAPKYVDYITQKEPTPAPAPAPKVVKVPTKFWVPIHFGIDKWNITNYEEVSIIAAADAIKDMPENVKIAVTGYADIQTASAEYNRALSERRAKAVADMLVNKYGVSRDRLIVSAKGGVENMWLNDNKVSRCVVISVAE